MDQDGHEQMAREPTSDGLLERLRALEVQYLSQRDEFDQMQRSVSESASVLATRLSKIEEHMSELAAIAKRVDQELQDFGRILECVPLSHLIASQVDAVPRATSLGILQSSYVRALNSNHNDYGYQYFTRTLTAENRELLIGAFQAAFSEELKRGQLSYLASRVCRVEADCLGRIAANIEDILVRVLVAKLMAFARPARSIAVLEIGTLFGIGLVAMADAIAAMGASMSGFAIDPLDGYYQKTSGDLVTGIEVNEANFWRNTKIVEAFSKIELIKGFSHEDWVLDQARRRAYDLIIVDGDHSYEGIKNDVEGYSSMLSEGGWMIIDDYDREEWKDVKRYVDDEMLSGSWRVVLKVFQTIVVERAEKI